LIEQINSAQQSIHIAAFEFNLTPVAEALIAAHERGVEVRWVTDDEFGLEADEEADHGQFAMLQNAGIEVRDDGRSALMHNKFVIFDGQVVWTGSTNLTRNDNFRNNNNVLVLRSQRVAQMYEAEFSEMWEEGQFGPTSLSTLDRQSTTIDGTPVQVIFAAEDEAIDEILPLVENAEESIRFMAFSFTNAELGEAMLERAQAGVEVQGIFELRGSQTEFSRLRPLYCADLAVRQDGNPGTFHHKVIVIDSKTIITGSLNFSDNANDSNDENVLILTNPDIAAHYLQEYERRWAEAFDPNTPLSLLPSALAAEVLALGGQRINC
jgi:phosphatidylserine/phosphatidylglycerophosphate/cardiolipin synthase-like enzyme